MRRFFVPLLLGLAAAPLAAQRQRVELAALEARAVTDSNDPVAHYGLAMGYWEKKRWDDAEKSLRQALVVSPNYADAYLALSQLPVKRGKSYWERLEKTQGDSGVRKELVASLANYRRAFLLNPLVDLRLLGDVDLDRGFYRFDGRMVFLGPWWMSDLERAINKLNHSKYDEAARDIEKLAAKKPFLGENRNLPDLLLFWRGIIAAHQDSFPRAVDAFAVLTGRAKAREQDTTRFVANPMETNDYRFILATLLFLDGRYQHAIPTFRRTLEIDLALYPAHVQLARMHEARGELAEAMAERQLAVDVSPDNSDLLVDQAGTMIKAGKIAAALEPLAEAARVNRRDPRIPYLQGIAQEELGNAAASDSAFQRFLLLAPSRFDAQKQEITRRLQGRTP
jgi:tetratricopeptide (TPR) repeat protein